MRTVVSVGGVTASVPSSRISLPIDGYGEVSINCSTGGGVFASFVKKRVTPLSCLHGSEKTSKLMLNLDRTFALAFVHILIAQTYFRQ